MTLEFKVDVDSLASQVSGHYEEVHSDLMTGIDQLAHLTHQYIKETAQEKLGSQFSRYEENLHIDRKDNLWVITLDEEALYLEDGQKAEFMEWLLKDAKIGKNGRYKVIPFKHSTDPTTARPGISQEYAGQLKEHIKDLTARKNITHKNGQPIIGKINTQSIESKRPTENARYQGLDRVSVYQHKNKDGSIGHKAVTFRIISDKHKADGRWFRKETSGAKAFDNALDKATEIWENTILPEIMRKYE